MSTHEAPLVRTQLRHFWNELRKPADALGNDFKAWWHRQGQRTMYAYTPNASAGEAATPPARTTTRSLPTWNCTLAYGLGVALAATVLAGGALLLLHQAAFPLVLSYLAQVISAHLFTISAAALQWTLVGMATAAASLTVMANVFAWDVQMELLWDVTLPLGGVLPHIENAQAQHCWSAGLHGFFGTFAAGLFSPALMFVALHVFVDVFVNGAVILPVAAGITCVYLLCKGLEYAGERCLSPPRLS